MALRETLEQAVVASVQDSFRTMLSIEVVASDVHEDGFAGADLICTIGTAGKIEGSFSMAVSNSVACSIVSKMLQMQIVEMNADVVDGIREVVNMIAGGTKLRTSGEGYGFEISIPTVVQGNLMSISNDAGVEKIIKCFKGQDIELHVEFIYRVAQAHPAAQVSTSSAKMGAFDRLKAMTAKAG